MGRFAVLCVLCLGVSWTPAAAGSDTTGSDLPVGILDQLNEAIATLVVARLKQPLTELGTRLDAMESKLGARLDTITDQLTELGTRLDSTERELITRLDNTERELITRLNDTERQLITRLNSTEKELGTRLDTVERRLSETEARLLPPPPPPRDCGDLLARHPAGLASGVYTIQPAGRGGPFHFTNTTSTGPVSAYCDMETDGGGWTVFQRRDDITPRQDFYLDWQQYRRGFGRLDGEFWWGNELLHQLTQDTERQYELRVDLEDWEGQTRHAVYGRFSVGPESDGYRLQVAEYSGDAGDSLRRHNGRKFSTKDRDQDTKIWSCAVFFKGAWWFSDCHDTHLNGPYIGQNNTVSGKGIIWYDWKGYTYSLKRTEMKVRRKSAE